MEKISIIIGLVVGALSILSIAIGLFGPEAVVEAAAAGKSAAASAASGSG